jgi:hypothetical protein
MCGGLWGLVKWLTGRKEWYIANVELCVQGSFIVA